MQNGHDWRSKIRYGLQNSRGTPHQKLFDGAWEKHPALDFNSFFLYDEWSIGARTYSTVKNHLTFVDIVDIVESFSRSSLFSFSISVLAWWTSASFAEFSLCNPFSNVVDCIFCLLSFSLSLVSWEILLSFSAISVRKEAIVFVVAFGSVFTQVVALGYNKNAKQAA